MIVIMKEFNILFIDEEKDQQYNFLDYMDNVEDKVDVVCRYPSANMEDMLQVIDDANPDAIVTDFQLNEIKTDITYNVPFTGADIVDEYRQTRPEFPCFVITSFDEDAIISSKDVNLVYEKGILSGGEKDVKAKFYDKIIEQIKKYKQAIISAQDEISSLIEKKQTGKISLNEENRIIELDSFLEKTLDPSCRLPDSMKKPENLAKLSSLVDKVDSILAKMN